MEKATSSSINHWENYPSRYRKKMKDSAFIPQWVTLLCFLISGICFVLIVKEGINPGYKFIAEIVGSVAFIVGLIGGIESSVIADEVKGEIEQEIINAEK